MITFLGEMLRINKEKDYLSHIITHPETNFKIALLLINLSGRGFRWFSLVWSALFLLLNIAHLAEALFVEKFDISQVCLQFNGR